MIPNQSSNNNGCTDNMSSNCVVWQGPDLTCIEVCNGDTVSNVVASMAEKLCEVIENSGGGIDITTVNQKCLIADYGTAATIQELFNNIIDKLCNCCAISQTPTDPCSCVIEIPDCLRKAARDYANNGTSPISFALNNDPSLGPGRGYAHFLALQICENISAISLMQLQVNNLEQRVTFIEDNCCSPSSAPSSTTDKVVASNSTGNNSPVTFATAIGALDDKVGSIDNTVGTAQQINTAVAYTPALSQKDRLSGSGTMAATRGWITTPKNMAQSFQNLWITMNDTRNAVENLNETVAKPTCADITFDVVATTQKGPTGNVTGLIFDFQGTSIPKAFSECNSRGTKLTVTDSSLNTVSFYVDVEYYQNNTPYILATSSMGNLDLASNYSVRIDFCASDGNTTCQEIQNITIENELGCPTLTIGTVTADSIPFTVSNINLPVNKGHIVNVELLNKAGSLQDSRSFTFQGRDITGTFTNLVPNTQYQVKNTLTQDGKVGTTDCPVQLVSTSTPVCSTVLYTPASSEWRTSRSDLVTGGNVVELASYNSGVSQTKWEVGFDSSYNPIVVMASATGITGWNHSGKFINDELTTEPLQITGLTGSPVSPAGITRSNLESGWKYMGTITDPNSQLYYVYAAVDTNNKSIKQVVFACNCSGIYLDTTQPVYYSRTSATTDITLNVIGYTAGSEEHTWAITTQPAHGTLAYKAGSPTNSSATYVYTQNGDFMTSDSFVITLSNACGTTIGTKYVQILPSQRIRYTSTDVIVFFDTNAMTTANAADIKKSFNAIRSGFSGATKPNFYYVAVNGTESGDYLKHVKGCVEHVGAFNSAGSYGAALSYPTSGTWYTDIMSNGATLPSYWTTTGAEFPPDVHIISFVGQVNANGTYGKASLPGTPGWGTPSEPTTNSGSGTAQYQEDYDAIVDITSSAAPTSAWGIACQAQTSFPWVSGSIPFTVSQVVVTLLNDIAGTTASVALQAFAALQGENLLSTQEYYGAALGLERYRNHGAIGTGLDLTAYLLSGVASVNIPYSVTTNGAGNTMVGLKDVSPSNYFNAVHAYIENGTDLDLSTNPMITTYFRGMFGLLSSGSTGEPSSAGGQRMGSTATYAVQISGSTDADKILSACTQAKTASNCINIYNSTGTQFDTTVRAYTTLSGLVNEQSEYELENGKFYALCPGGTGVNVARYSTTSPHWNTVSTCP